MFIICIILCDSISELHDSTFLKHNKFYCNAVLLLVFGRNIDDTPDVNITTAVSNIGI